MRETDPVQADAMQEERDRALEDYVSKPIGEVLEETSDPLSTGIPNQNFSMNVPEGVWSGKSSHALEYDPGDLPTTGTHYCTIYDNDVVDNAVVGATYPVSYTHLTLPTILLV